jgi:nucleotide-binding universal stress UspA family protein
LPPRRSHTAAGGPPRRTAPATRRHPIYSKVVVGFEPNERGEDARALAALLAREAGGELDEVHVEHGSPAKALREMAERGAADLIVLGSTHRAAFGAVAPGSVAEHLLDGAPARLAIAPKGYSRARTAMEANEGGGEGDGATLPFVRDELRVIAVGFNGTAESQAALDEAAELAGRTGATIRLIGVSLPMQAVGAAAGVPMPPESIDSFQAKLHDAAAALPSGLRVLPIHERGEPAERLIERAGQGVDLLVLGSRGFGRVMRLLLGSVSSRVIREAPCPVMVVPYPREASA